MSSDLEKTDQIVLDLGKGVCESAVADGDDMVSALMYFRNDEQIAVTLHADPLKALRFAAPLCAAAWDADVVYFLCATLIVKFDAGEMTQDDVMKWFAEKNLQERWKDDDRANISESMTIHRITPVGEPVCTVTEYERVGGVVVWGETITTDERGVGNVPDLSDNVFSEEVKTKFEEAMTSAFDTGEEMTPAERMARRMAYPIMALGASGLMQGGSLLGNDPEVRDMAEAILNDLKNMHAEVVDLDDGVEENEPW